MAASRRRQIGWRLLRILVGLGLLGWLIAAAAPEFSLLVDVWQRWPLLLAALGLAVAVQVLGALRFGRILWGQGLQIPQGEIQSSCWVASFLNQALLGTLGGDAYRSARLVRGQQAPVGIMLWSVLLDRLSGLWLVLLLAPLAWPWLPSEALTDGGLGTWMWGIVGALALPPFLLLVLCTRPGRGLWRRIEPRFLLAGLGAFARRLRSDPRGCWSLLGLGLGIQVLVVGIHLLLARALFPELGLDVPLFCFVVPVAVLAIALPVNPPGAVGTAEAIYQFLFAWAGVEEGAVLALLLRLILLLQCLPGAIIWLRRKPGVA